MGGLGGDAWLRALVTFGILIVSLRFIYKFSQQPLNRAWEGGGYGCGFI